MFEWSMSSISWLKRERGWNLCSPFAIIWKPSGQNKMSKITSLPLTPRLYKTLQTTGQEIPWRIRTLWNVIRAMNQREGFQAMKAKVNVLPKHDFNYKLKLVSNDDCYKRFEFFRALALEKTQIGHDLPPRFSRILCSSLLFADDLFSVCFQERLCISFSPCCFRYSPFYLCLLLLSFAFLSP